MGETPVNNDAPAAPVDSGNMAQADQTAAWGGVGDAGAGPVDAGQAVVEGPAEGETAAGDGSGVGMEADPEQAGALNDLGATAESIGRDIGQAAGEVLSSAGEALGTGLEGEGQGPAGASLEVSGKVDAPTGTDATPHAGFGDTDLGDNSTKGADILKDLANMAGTTGKDAGKTPGSPFETPTPGSAADKHQKASEIGSQRNASEQTQAWGGVQETRAGGEETQKTRQEASKDLGSRQKESAEKGGGNSMDQAQEALERAKESARKVGESAGQQLGNTLDDIKSLGEDLLDKLREGLPSGKDKKDDELEKKLKGIPKGEMVGILRDDKGKFIDILRDETRRKGREGGGQKQKNEQTRRWAELGKQKPAADEAAGRQVEGRVEKPAAGSRREKFAGTGMDSRQEGPQEVPAGAEGGQPARSLEPGKANKGDEGLLPSRDETRGSRETGKKGPPAGEKLPTSSELNEILRKEGGSGEGKIPKPVESPKEAEPRIPTMKDTFDKLIREAEFDQKLKEIGYQRTDKAPREKRLSQAEVKKLFHEKVQQGKQVGGNDFLGEAGRGATAGEKTPHPGSMQEVPGGSGEKPPEGRPLSGRDLFRDAARRSAGESKEGNPLDDLQGKSLEGKGAGRDPLDGFNLDEKQIRKGLAEFDEKHFTGPKEKVRLTLLHEQLSDFKKQGPGAKDKLMDLSNLPGMLHGKAADTADEIDRGSRSREKLTYDHLPSSQRLHLVGLMNSDIIDSVRTSPERIDRAAICYGLAAAAFSVAADLGGLFTDVNAGDRNYTRRFFQENMRASEQIAARINSLQEISADPERVRTGLAQGIEIARTTFNKALVFSENDPDLRGELVHAAKWSIYTAAQKILIQDAGMLASIDPEAQGRPAKQTGSAGADKPEVPADRPQPPPKTERDSPPSAGRAAPEDVGDHALPVGSRSTGWDRSGEGKPGKTPSLDDFPMQFLNKQIQDLKGEDGQQVYQPGRLEDLLGKDAVADYSVHLAAQDGIDADMASGKGEEKPGAGPEDRVLTWTVGLMHSDAVDAIRRTPDRDERAAVCAGVSLAAFSAYAGIEGLEENILGGKQDFTRLDFQSRLQVPRDVAGVLRAARDRGVSGEKAAYGVLRGVEIARQKFNTALGLAGRDPAKRRLALVDCANTLSAAALKVSGEDSGQEMSVKAKKEEQG